MALLSGDVDIPHVGRLPKIAVAGGVGLVIVLIIIERRKQATTTAAAADPYPPDGSTGNEADPNSTDPATGATYGDEAAGYPGSLSPLDSGDLGGGYGSLGAAGSGDAYPWDGTYGNTSDPFSIDPGSGVTYGNEGTSGTPTGTAGPPFSTNAQWSQYVLGYFSTNQYSDLGGRTDAVGLYIGGQAVSAPQKQYIDDAIAVGGPPPVAGASGFPPSIRSAGTTTTTSAPGQSPTLSATPHAGYADFGWSAVTRAEGYDLTVTGAGGKGTGTSHVDQHIATGTHAEHVALAPGGYRAQVRAVNTAGKGPWSAWKPFTVPTK